MNPNISGRLRWPNIHEWALLGFFAMTFYLLKMVRDNPALLGVPSFMQFASQLAGGGLLLAAAWLYSSSKPPKSDGPSPDVTVQGESVTVEETKK